jgi:hypothetical protein
MVGIPFVVGRNVVRSGLFDVSRVETIVK